MDGYIVPEVNAESGKCLCRNMCQKETSKDQARKVSVINVEVGFHIKETAQKSQCYKCGGRFQETAQ